jgi:hypothetical protein
MYSLRMYNPYFQCFLHLNYVFYYQLLMPIHQLLNTEMIFFHHSNSRHIWFFFEKSFSQKSQKNDLISRFSSAFPDRKEESDKF